MTKTKEVTPLDRLLVRGEHVLCTQCYEVEPIHCGNGTPAPAFIAALQMMAARHFGCKFKSPSPQAKDTSND